MPKKVLPLYAAMPISAPYLLIALTVLVMITVEMIEAMTRVRNASCLVLAQCGGEEVRDKALDSILRPSRRTAIGRGMSGHLSRVLEIRELTISSVKLTKAEILPLARTPHAAPIKASPVNPMPMQ
jgi:hypothetical protein